MFVSVVFVIVVFSKLLGFSAAVGARISALKILLYAMYDIRLYVIKLFYYYLK